jgi:hypothetical protein
LAGPTYPGFLKEGLPSRFPRREASSAEMPAVHKGRRGKHDSLVQQEADPTARHPSIIDGAEKLVQVQQRHVGVDVFHVCLQQCILDRDGREREGALCLEECDILEG